MKRHHKIAQQQRGPGRPPSIKRGETQIPTIQGIIKEPSCSDYEFECIMQCPMVLKQTIVACKYLKYTDVRFAISPNSMTVSGHSSQQDQSAASSSPSRAAQVDVTYDVSKLASFYSSGTLNFCIDRSIHEKIFTCIDRGCIYSSLVKRTNEDVLEIIVANISGSVRTVKAGICLLDQPITNRVSDIKVRCSIDQDFLRKSLINSPDKDKHIVSVEIYKKERMMITKHQEGRLSSVEKNAVGKPIFEFNCDDELVWFEMETLDLRRVLASSTAKLAILSYHSDGRIYIEATSQLYNIVLTMKEILSPGEFLNY